jgi:hypothetical protein
MREGSQGPRREAGRRAAVVAWGLWALAAGSLASLDWLDHLLARAGRPT